MNQTELVSKLRASISNQRLSRLLSRIDDIENIGAVIGMAYPVASFKLGDSFTESPRYFASAFCDFSSISELSKAIASSSEINREPYLPKSKLSASKRISLDRWLRDFWSVFESWRVLLEIDIPKSQQATSSNGTLIQNRPALCQVYDFLQSIADFPFLPASDVDKMSITIDSKIAKVVHARAIPTHDPWLNSPIKNAKPIVDRYWNGRDIDLRSLVLIGDMRFYFESILLSVIDWVNRKNQLLEPAIKLTVDERKFIEALKNAKGERVSKEALSKNLSLHPKTVERFARELPVKGYDVRNDWKEKTIPGYYLKNWSTI